MASGCAAAGASRWSGASKGRRDTSYHASEDSGDEIHCFAADVRFQRLTRQSLQPISAGRGSLQCDGLPTFLRNSDALLVTLATKG